MRAQTTAAKDEPSIWVADENILDGNKLRIKASRAFKHSDSLRTWKLGVDR